MTSEVPVRRHHLDHARHQPRRARRSQTLPTGRNYSSVVQITPGVSSDANPENTAQSSITVYGSTGAENVFYIDGVNTTGVEYGFQGKELNFEFIQAIDVKTGGYEAEYGRSTGGIINVITKSGGNEFHGDLFGYCDDDSLQSAPDPVVSTGGTVDGFTREDYGIGLGGFLVKDRLWFFAAYDRVDQHARQRAPRRAARRADGQQSDSDRDLAAAKLTWRLSDSQSLDRHLLPGPAGRHRRDQRRPALAQRRAAHLRRGPQLRRQGLRAALRGRSSAPTGSVSPGRPHQEENSVGPATAAGDVIQFRAVDDDFFQTGGFGLIQEKEFERDFCGGSVTRFLGGHQIKVGLEYETETAEVTRRYSGGQQVDVFANAANPAGRSTATSTGRRPTATVGNAPVSALFASPEHKVTTALSPGPLGRAPEPDLQPRGALGPPGDHRRLGREADRPRRTTTRRGSASSGTRRRQGRRRSSARTAATTSRSRWTW